MRENKSSPENRKTSGYKNVAVGKTADDRKFSSKIIKQARKGRLKISVWDCKKTIAPPKEKRDFVPEYTQEFSRVCIQHGRYNRQFKRYDNQTIWMSPQELRDLQQIFDELDAIEDGEQGEESPAVSERSRQPPEISDFWKEHNRVTLR